MLVPQSKFASATIVRITMERTITCNLACHQIKEEAGIIILTPAGSLEAQSNSLPSLESCTYCSRCWVFIDNCCHDRDILLMLVALDMNRVLVHRTRKTMRREQSGWIDILSIRHTDYVVFFFFLNLRMWQNSFHSFSQTLLTWLTTVFNALTCSIATYKKSSPFLYCWVNQSAIME